MKRSQLYPSALYPTASLLIIFLFMLVSTFTLPNDANAEYRIATVDMNRILNETPEAVSAKKRLDKETASIKKRIASERENLKRKEEKLRKAQVSTDSKEAEAFRKEAREFGRSVKDSEDELRRKFGKLNATLTEKTVSVIKKYAQSENIDLVLDKGMQGRGPVLFGTPHVDITEAVLKKLKG